MSEAIETLELAKLYESQGYYEDAFQIYSFLAEEHPSNEIKAGKDRMGKKIKAPGQALEPEKNIARLFEKWLKLMVLKQRLNNFSRIKSRLL